MSLNDHFFSEIHLQGILVIKTNIQLKVIKTTSVPWFPAGTSDRGNWPLYIHSNTTSENKQTDIFPTHIYSLFILLTVNKLFQSSLSFPHVLIFKRHITDRISITKLIKNLEEYLPSFPKVLLASDIMRHTNAQLYHWPVL